MFSVKICYLPRRLEGIFAGYLEDLLKTYCKMKTFYTKPLKNVLKASSRCLEINKYFLGYKFVKKMFSQTQLLLGFPKVIILSLYIFSSMLIFLLLPTCRHVCPFYNFSSFSQFIPHVAMYSETDSRHHRSLHAFRFYF